MTKKNKGLEKEDIQVCIRFKQILETKGINQTEAGKIMGVNQNTISRIVLQRKKPSLSLIRKILIHFDVNPSWLILGSNEPMFIKDKYKKGQMIDKNQIKAVAKELKDLASKVVKISS